MENYVAMQLLNLTQGIGNEVTGKWGTCISAATRPYHVCKEQHFTFCLHGILNSETLSWSYPLHTKKISRITCKLFEKWKIHRKGLCQKGDLEYIAILQHIQSLDRHWENRDDVHHLSWGAILCAQPPGCPLVFTCCEEGPYKTLEVLLSNKKDTNQRQDSSPTTTHVHLEVSPFPSSYKHLSVFSFRH